MTGSLKQMLVKIGAIGGARTIFALNAAVNYVAVGHWMERRNLTVRHRFNHRSSLFQWAADQIKDRRVLYLEFGVFKGETVKLWSKLLRNPESLIHGFDSFEGLPENWTALYGKGYFSTQGVLPDIGDSRVKFYKGWFDETLPNYVPPPHEELFVNIDADLYSSAQTVLKYMRPHLHAGAYLYFDQFHHREHEMKAFDEFVQETGFEFEVLGATKQLSEVLFRRIK